LHFSHKLYLFFISPISAFAVCLIVISIGNIIIYYGTTFIFMHILYLLKRYYFSGRLSMKFAGKRLIGGIKFYIMLLFLLIYRIR
jgi:hypothetical protein